MAAVASEGLRLHQERQTQAAVVAGHQKASEVLQMVDLAL
jgi:hypothetical protein